AAVFAVIACWPLLRSGHPRWWALALATAFLAVALFIPAALRPLNLIWFKFGLLLSKVVTPLIMGGVYLLVITPTGLIMRARGKILLRRIDKRAKSYWIERQPPGPSPETMTRQH